MIPPLAPLNQQQRPDAAPLRPVELLVVAVVWLFFIALNVATALVDPHGPPPSLGLPRVNLRILINPILWAFLTTFILWVSRRLSLDRDFWRRRLVVVVIIAVLVANASDMVSDLLWDAFAPAAAVQFAQRFGEPKRFRPGLLNLTWLDDLAVVLGALAIAAARGWALRERARSEEARRRGALLEADTAQVREHAAQLHAQLAEARLDALRRQIDPHFLFNTLNAVSALVERDPRGVRRMIGQLSDLLRHSTDSASTPEIPLRQELDLLGRYVDIMRVRFEDKLEVETRADPRALDAFVPNMILQPLVENAIKYGVESRNERVRVEIEAELDGETLVIRVRDDGPGMPAWSAPSSNETASSAGGRERGVGLQNTAARLAQLYSSAHHFTVGPGPGGGTVAELRFPYHTQVTRVG